jgi:ankyrin repeat protein
VSDYGRTPHEVGPAADPADEFLRLACLVYGGDDLARPARAAEMLRADRSLAGRSIHTAAAVGDAQAAARMLAADPSLASSVGGPFDWEPLLYAAYSRVASDDRADSQVEVARLLLERGADPNAGYLWDGTYLFTALTGAFGSGEDAPNQPPHHESIALARLLLEAGADPNDELLGLCLRGAGEEVARRLTPDPGLAERLNRRHDELADWLEERAAR